MLGAGRQRGPVTESSSRPAGGPAAGPRRDIVVVACSAGGLGPLKQLIAGLTPDLPAAVLVVRHVPADGHSGLPKILERVGRLPVVHARHGAAIRPAHVYVAPPDNHMLVHAGETWLSRGPRINRVRPSADALFRSAARWCGPRVIGVVLSGALDDGADGLAAIVERGGTALVQDPGEALSRGMPEAALWAVPGATALRAEAVAATVNELAGSPSAAPAGPVPQELIWETDMIELDESGDPLRPPLGRPAALSCPECRGGMSAVETGGGLHYRCHVGHSFSPATMLAAQAEQGEAALWSAVAILEEQARVRHELAHRAGNRHRRRERAEHLAAAQDASAAARAVRGCMAQRPERGAPG